MRLCEITLEKEKVAAGDAASKRPNILHRRIEVPELKRSVRLKVSTEGVKIIQSAGGLVKFLEKREDQKLSKKLRSLKQKLRDQGIIKASEPEPEKLEEATPEAAAEPEAAAPAEKPAENPEEKKAEKKEAKVEEKAAEAEGEKKAEDLQKEASKTAKDEKSE